MLSSIKLALAIFVMLLAFSPFYATIINTKFKDSTLKSEVIIYKGASSFFNFEYIESQKEEYDEFANLSVEETTDRFKVLFSAFSNFRSFEARNGKANAVNDACLVFAYATAECYEYEMVFILVPVFVLIGVLFAGIVMHQIMLYFITGKKKRLLVTWSSIGQLVSNSLALVLALASVLILRYYSFDIYAPKGYEIILASGVIILVNFSIALLCIPQGKNQDDLLVIE